MTILDDRPVAETYVEEELEFGYMCTGHLAMGDSLSPLSSWEPVSVFHVSKETVTIATQTVSIKIARACTVDRIWFMCDDVAARWVTETSTGRIHYPRGIRFADNDACTITFDM